MDPCPSLLPSQRGNSTSPAGRASPASWRGAVVGGAGGLHSSPAAWVQECTAGGVQGVVTGESGELFHPDFLDPQSWRRQRAQEATADEPVFPLFCHREPADRLQQSRPQLTLQEQLGMSVVLGLASSLSPTPEPVATYDYESISIC